MLAARPKGRRGGARRVPARAALTLSAAAALGVALMAGTAAAAPGPGTAASGQWPVAGQNLSNTHDNAAEYQISPANVGTLKPKWVLTTAGDVTATPTECGGTVYVPDLGGKLWAVNAQTGAVRWSHAVSGYTGIAGDASRTSPAVYGNELIAGDGYIGNPVAAPARLFAVNRATGQLLWSTQVDSVPGSIITSSPVAYNGVVYAGSMLGNMNALDARTGAILWHFASGGSVGPGPAIAGGTVYWGSGYSFSPTACPAGGCGPNNKLYAFTTTP